MSRAKTVALRITVALATIAVLLYLLDTDKILAAIARLNPFVALTASLMIFLGIPLSAMRWHYLLRRLGVNLPQRSVMRMTFIGMLSSLGLPSAHGGDVVRGVMLASTKQARLDHIVSSLLADRAYGVLSIGVVALPGAVALFTHDGGANAAWGLLAVSVLGLMLVLLLPWLFVLAVSVTDWIIVKLMQQHGARFAQGIRDTMTGLASCFENWKTVAPALFLSIMVHTLAIIAAWALGTSMSIDISPLAYFAIVPAVWITTMIPVSIGGLGVREASFAILFSLFGADPEQGLALGAAVSATGILGILMGGAVVAILPADPA